MPEKKKSQPPKKPSSRSTRGSQIGNISNVSGTANVAGRDIITHINNIQNNIQPELTPGQVVETDLQIEITRLEQGIWGYLEDLKIDALNERSSSPYKDLESYTLSDAGQFFGREQAILDLQDALERHLLTILQAESGAGKTSLLQAGLVPRLMTEDQLAIWLRPQYVDPALVIKRKFLGDLKLTPKLAGAPLVDFLRRIHRIMGGHTTLYLILDQFEEIFSKHTDELDRLAFIRELAECLNDATLNVRWVISLTTDALGQLFKLEPYIQVQKLKVQTLDLFSRDEAAEVIAKPAQRHGLTFEAGLLERLLDDLGQKKNAPIAPTQIQLVCMALYKDLRGKGTVFTKAQYEQKGGTEGILRGYVGNVLRHDLPFSERAPAYKILEELVTSEKKRTIRLKTDLETALASMGISQDLAESTLNHLVKSHLLRRLGDQAEEVQYEIVHDYLLNEIEINDALRSLKEAEELLEQGVKNWRRFGVILSGDALAIIGTRKRDLSFTPEALCVLLLSLVDMKKHTEDWRFYLHRAKQKIYSRAVSSILVPFISHANKRVREGAQKVLWNFLRDCPAPERSKIILWNLGFRMPIYLWQAFLISFVLMIAYVLTWITSRDQLEQLGWQVVQSLAPGCRADHIPESLVIVADPSNPANILVFGESQSYVCQSTDAGDSWVSIFSGLPPDLKIISMAVYKEVVILVSANQVFFRNVGNNRWDAMAVNNRSDQEYRSVTIDGKGRQLFIASLPLDLISIDLTQKCWEGLKQEKTLKDSEKGLCWDRVGTGDISGVIHFVATNEKYIAAVTDEGAWYSQLETIDWQQQPGLAGEVLSFAMHHNSLLDDGVFFVILPDLGVQRGEFGIPTLLTSNEWPFPSENSDGIWDWPKNTKSIAVSQYVYFARTSESIQRYPGWSIFDRAWWRIMRAARSTQ